MNLCKKDIDDMREVLFTLFDSACVVGGGKETRLGPELSLLKETVDKLVERKVISSSIKNNIIPGFIEAAQKGNGQKAHFWGRMLFSDVINKLQKAARESV